MILKPILFATAAVLVTGSFPSARAAVIFSDDFESGTLANWTTSATSPLVISTAQNASPAGPGSSALMDTSLDRMHHNLLADNSGVDILGHTTFTSWIFDAPSPNPATRIYNEVRGYSSTGMPNGGLASAAAGTLTQLIAVGKTNSTTLETYNGTKYQARIAFGSVTNGTTGWFNLDGAGSPNRTPGWHRFDVERLADGVSYNFYVDGILSKSLTGAAVSDWDSVVLGPGLGSTVGDAYIDAISVSTGAPVFVPEPSAAALGLLGLAGITGRRRRR